MWGGNLANQRSATIHRGCYSQISLSHRRQQYNYTVLLRVHITLSCQLMVFPFNLHSPPALDYPQDPSWQISQGIMGCHSAPCPKIVPAVHCQATAPDTVPGYLPLQCLFCTHYWTRVLFAVKLESRVRLQQWSYWREREIKWWSHALPLRGF